MSTEVSDKPKVKMNIKAESENESKTRPQPAIEMEGGSSVSGSPATIKVGRNEGVLVTDKARKIGHRRVNEQGMVTYKKKGIIELKSPSALLTFSNEVCCKLMRHNTISRFIRHPSKKSTTELMSAIQLGIGQSITLLSSKPKRDLLLQDFSIVETVFFPKDGSSSTPPHEYSDFRFKTYAPVAFRYFRELFGIQPDDFLISLSNYPLKELSNPGASGSIFYITDDDEFIIKTVSNKEADFLQKLLPGYYMNLNQNPRTLLPKFYGLFCYQCGGKNIRFVVMNNLLPMSIKMHEKYDLKGSTYKRKASREERSKKSPTLKDLDFVNLHPEGIMLEGDTFSALLKTIERDCRVLQSFQIMDYSLLMSVHNLDQAVKERETVKDSENESPTGQSGNVSSGDNGGNSAKIARGRSIHQRLAQFSTTMEAIHAKSEPLEIDEDEVPIGGIPARSFRGERLLLYIGIIDILQSYRLAKKLEHAVKSIIHDGDTISVHRPGFYAQRFQNFFNTTVFKKIPSLDQPQVKGAVRFKKLVQIALRHSPTSRKSLPGPGKATAIGVDTKMEFGGRPDVLPSATPPPTSSMGDLNLASSEKRYSSSLPVSMEMARHLNSPAHTVGSTTASTPTHTSLTEGTPSYTASSPSCSTISTLSHLLEQQGTPINSLAAGDMDTKTISQSSAPIQQATMASGQSSASINLPDRTGEVTEGTDVDGLKVGTLSREVTETLLQMSYQISEEEVIVSTKL